MRNIANVVHDLRPVVKYLKEKLLVLRETNDPEELAELLTKLDHDAVMLELYLNALEKDVKENKVVKIKLD